ncbi:MAG: class I SAM-dependent rRNA methyltransferase [Oscillatoriales cyanobacterium SM2_1_8]|nr:class I SAM-dependent rRNA methyltransferase [Oscillatoriales cyanobacterium SM2_1_8]
MNYPQVVLHDRKAEAVKRFHPWIFSGAIAQRDRDLTEGQLVEVRSSRGEFLALGYFGTGSLAVKVLSFAPVADLGSLIRTKLARAWQNRHDWGVATAQTTAWRWVNAEGDGLPGLIVDWYDGVAVVQCHGAGPHGLMAHWLEGLRAAAGDRLRAIYDQSGKIMAGLASGYVWGQAQPGFVQENGLKFWVDWETGQKTGFFLDQRDNRAICGRYAVGRRVLNAFGYTGGFSVYAAAGGAIAVDTVDSSVPALQIAAQNMQANPSDLPHRAIAADVFAFLSDLSDLSEDRDPYDLVVLDPPAFAKNLRARTAAIAAYRRLNRLGLARVAPGGLLLTFSCSQVVDRIAFEGTVTAAALDSGRTVRLLGRLGPPADHPISLFHPEGTYLKGLVLAVEP